MLSSSGSSEEKIEIIVGHSNVIEKALECISNSTEKIDNCFDSSEPSTIVSMQNILQASIDFIKRGGRIRMITEITRNNLSYCKELMKYTEMRHLDGIKVNFAVSEREYLSYIIPEDTSKHITHAIYNNIKNYVREQQFLFDTLWNKATPANQKIIEIEEGIEPEVIETIKDPTEIMNLCVKLVKSAKKEILAIFPTTINFLNQRQSNIARSLLDGINEYKQQNNNNIQVKILTPYNQAIKEIIQESNRNKLHQQQQQHSEYSNKVTTQEQLDLKQPIITTRYIEPHLQTKVLLLVVDKQYSLAVELKEEDDKKNSDTRLTSSSNNSNATTTNTGLSTYSNSKPTVLSFVSIFEALWNQVELDEKLKESYKLLELANEQLKLNDLMQKEFIGIAAHELKNPTQPIMGLSEVMRIRVTNEEQRRLIDIIIRNANRLQHLAEELLDVSKIESGIPLRLFKSEFKIYDLIESIIEDVKSKGQTPDIQINISHDFDKDSVIYADRDRIAQVIINLLNNAIKFVGKNNSIHISLARKDEDMVIISIKDTGTGIDPEVLPRLFSKFVSKSKKGTGFGLYLSKAIIEAHGGRIWAENNTDGKGATFSFRLPSK